MNAWEGISRPFKIHELRNRVLFTIGLISVYRLGSFIPTPGINAVAFQMFFAEMQRSMAVAGLFNLFTGGALERLSIFALGIMPYISASIIMSLTTHIIPSLEKIQKEGQEGTRKISQYTRYLTVLIALIQAFGMAIGLEMTEYRIPIVTDPGLGFRIMTVLTMTTGAMFVMWLGEQITEKGLGNGASLLIFANIVARVPEGIGSLVQDIFSGETNILKGAILLALVLLVIAGVVIMIQGHRKITVQYAKRIVGRKVYGGQMSHLPLQINMAGVIPIIFASSLITFPAMIGGFLGGDWYGDLLLSIPRWIQDAFSNLLYAGLTIFFVYFYISIIFNPNDVADNLRKSGGFVPGIRPGRNTADYIHKILNRITFVGAIFLALAAIIPTIALSSLHSPFFFGGTSIMIVVGVALDTLRQVESHLMMHHYEGFIKKAKLRGRF
ncbi:MAG: preprotein translocase subunit SecY [bacterium]|nr:preprotein translocase subunit SecY [bacterium]